MRPSARRRATGGDEDVGIEDVAGALQTLDAFLVDNAELEALNARLSTFNLFRVLRAERVEIRHSNVLAWLLSPDESHGLGDAFVRRLMSRLLLDNEMDGVHLTPARVELMDFDDVEVRREWKHIDIVVTSASGGWAVLLENKIGSGEHSNQLVRYWAELRGEMPDATVIPVLLSLQGDEPSDEGRELGFVSLAYTDVLATASRIVEQHRSRIPRDAQVVIDHYIETLRRLTMQDEELVALCKAIYKKHRDAIDLIVEYGASSQVLDACEETIRELIPSRFLLRTVNRVFFVPEAHPDWEVPELRGWTILKRNLPVVWWLHYGKKRGRVQMSLEVGPITDADMRIDLIERLRDAGFKIRKDAFRRETKYTRIVSESKLLRSDASGDPDDSPEHVRDVVEALWKRAWEQGQVAVPIFEEFAARSSAD